MCIANWPSISIRTRLKSWRIFKNFFKLKIKQNHVESRLLRKVFGKLNKTMLIWFTRHYGLVVFCYKKGKNNPWSARGSWLHVLDRWSQKNPHISSTEIGSSKEKNICMGLEVKIIFDMLSFNPTLNSVIKRFFVAIILSQRRPFPLKSDHFHRRLTLCSNVT